MFSDEKALNTRAPLYLQESFVSHVMAWTVLRDGEKGDFWSLSRANVWDSNCFLLFYQLWPYTVGTPNSSHPPLGSLFAYCALELVFFLLNLHLHSLWFSYLILMHELWEVLGLAGQHFVLQGSSPSLPGGSSLGIIIRIISSLENLVFSADTSLVPGSAGTG